MQNKHYNLLSYCLTLVGYMTLTISLPLLSFIAKHLNISYADAQYGVSILFFTFSISAILLSSLSDMFGVFAVLKYAQLLSIIGLCILSFSQNKIIFLSGCFCLGSGTGCYASNARALISRHAPNEESMKKSFSTMSILIILAPIASFYLAMTMNILSWRFAYAAMALIEIILAIYALWVLSHEDTSYRHNKFSNLVIGFIDCLKQKVFFLNMVFLGVSLSIFMQLFMTNIHQLLITGLGISVAYFEVLLLFMSIIYIIGVFLFKQFGIKLPNHLIRIGLLLMLLAGILIFNFSHSLTLVMLGIYIVCGTLGFAVPFSTGSGMSVIKHHHGSAAALFTFSFACISGIWSIVQMHLLMSTKDFMNFGLWLSYVILLITCILLTMTTYQKKT